MKTFCLVLAAGTLLAAPLSASTLFRTDPWEYYTDYADYTQGCKVVAHADLHPTTDPRVLTGWEENGEKHSKRSLIFADKNQHEWFIVDLGRVRPCGKIVVPTGLNDVKRVPGQVSIYGSTSGPDGPWTMLLENVDVSCKFTHLLDNPPARWLKFDLGENTDGIGSRVGGQFGVYKKFELPDVPELMMAFHPKFRRDEPGLEKFWEKIDAEDWTGAASALRTYEEKRYSKQGIPPHYKVNADLALENKIDLGNGIVLHYRHGVDWQIHPDEATAGPHRGWAHSHLAKAYSATGDLRYAGKLAEWLETWLEQLPRPPETLASTYDMWFTLDVAARTGHWFVVLQIIVKDRENFSDKLFLNLLYNIWEQYDYLYYAGEEDGNWLAAVTRSMAGGSRLFSEFVDCPAWLEFAKDKFALNMMRDVYPDGKEYENSSGYVAFAYGMLLGIHNMLNEMGVDIPRAVERRIKLGIDWSTWILQPSGITFMIGDSNGADGPRTDAARTFDRPDLLYMCTQGKEGAQPSTASRHFPISGWFVMRSNWDERPFDQARQLLMVAAPHGPHGHHDQLSIYCYAYGRTLLSVPSRLNDANYSMKEHWETLYTWSKNTVVVDGQTQGFGNEPGVERKCKDVRWFHGSNLDLADATHTLYPEVEHRRRVLFVRGDYWVVIDDMTPKPEADQSVSHTYDQHFHFNDGTDVVEMDNEAVRSDYRGAGNLMLIPLEPERLALSEKTSTPVNYIGMEAPTMYGWKYRVEGSGHQQLVTVLYPYPKGGVPTVRVRKLDATPGVVALEVKTPSGTDVIYAGDKVEKHRYRHLADAEARVFVARFDTDGDCARATGLDVAQLKAGDYAFASQETPRDSVEFPRSLDGRPGDYCKVTMSSASRTSTCRKISSPTL